MVQFVSTGLASSQTPSRVGANYSTITPQGTTVPTISQDQLDRIAETTFNQVNQGMNLGRSRTEVVARTVLGTGVNLVDNVWSSPLNPVGWVSDANAPGSVWSLASQEDQAFYTENKDLVDGTSGVLGALLTVAIGDKFVSKAVSGRLAASTTIANSSIYQSARLWESGSRLRAIAAQKEALLAGEKFSMLSSPAGREFLTAKVATTVGSAARQEALIYGVMWNNDAVNQEGIADDAFWIGVGLGLGAAVGGVQARSILRRSANSTDVRTALGSQLPMAGVSDMMTQDLAPASVYDKLTAAGKANEESATTTQLLVASRSNTTQADSLYANTAAKMDPLRNSAKQQAVDSIDRMFAPGIFGIPTPKTPLRSTPEIEFLVNKVAKEDPFVVHGVSQIGIAPIEIRTEIARRAVKVDETAQLAAKMARGKQSKKGLKLAAEMKRAKAQEPFAMINGSWVNPDSPSVAAALRFDQKTARARVQVLDQGAAVRTTLPTAGEVTFDGTLSIKRTGKTDPVTGKQTNRKLDYAKLDPVDRLYVQEGMQTLVKQLSKPGTPVKFKINERNRTDWLSLDLADEILEAGGKVEFEDARGLITNREQLQRESVRAKAQKLLNDVGQTGDITDDMRLAYNLPMATSFERLEDSAGSGFRLWLQLAASDRGSMWDLSQGLTRQRVFQGVDLMPPQGGLTQRLNGDMLKWNRNDKGDFMRPLLGYFNPVNQIQKISQRGMEEASSIKTSEMIATLVDRNKGGLVPTIARALLSMAETNTARKVSELNAAQSTGLGGGFGQLVSELLPFRSLNRDNPIILAASRLFEQVNRAAESTFRDMMLSSGLTKVITEIDTPAKAALAAQLDEFHSLRPGWDLLDAVEVEPGWFSYQLADTAKNRKFLGVDKISDGDFIQNLRTGKPIYLSYEAMLASSKFDDLMDELQAGENTIRKAKGRNAVNKMRHFVPTRSTKGKLKGWVFDENDQLIPMNAIIADTVAEYESKKARALADLPDNYKVKDSEQLADTRDIWDLEAIDWMHSGSNSAIAGKGTQTGGLTEAFVRPGAFKESIEWAKAKHMKQANETLQMMMADPIRLAKMRSVVEGGLSKGLQKADKIGERNIYDVYLQALTGNNYKYRQTALLSSAVGQVEKVIDKLLSTSAIAVPARHIVDMASRFGVSPTELSQKKTYDQIVKTMAAKSPYASAAEFVEANGYKMPTTVRSISEKLNRLATDIVLRWDPAGAHAMMNMLGLIPTLMSGTIAGSAPSTLQLAVKGRRVPMIDSMKIVREGMADMGRFRNDKNPDWVRMVDNGDASQSSYEHHQAMDSIKSQAGFKKWAHNIDASLAYMSDNSENLSRQIAHFTGLRMADYQGIKGMDARHSFAREFANAAIADYTPSNRPELYQTAIGSVFGLFQTYVTSQYTKMFHWIEDGNYRAAGTQAAFQASLFGLQGTYGIGSLFNLHSKFMDESGEPSIVDMAYKRFGPVLGGALMHGGFAELTQIALWTRGDISPSIPAVGQMPAGLDVLNRFAKMFVGTVESALREGPVDAMPAIVEHIQREMPNRMLKGILAVTTMEGRETDRFGAVMTDTRTWVDSIARIGGVRSRRMQQELTVFYQNKSSVDRDAARRSSLRMRFRTDLRSAESRGETIDAMAYFDDYVASGGNPASFRSFVRDALEDATSPRAATQLKRSLDTRTNNLQLWRYAGYGAWGIADGTTPAAAP